MRFSCLATLVALLALHAAASAQGPWKVPKEELGGAIPLNVNRWYNYTDYPDDAVRADQQGYVTVSFTIGVDGRMTNCKVIRSSGYPILDAVPCKVLPKRARFTPAKDANGAPVATQGS